MMLHAIAIDDEAPALAVIAAHAAKTPFLRLQECFTNPLDALSWLQQNPVDLIFLDVRMPDLPGIELMRLARASGALFVFVTAHAEYAVEGFELRALDYLLKPVLLPRFLEACNRALQQRQAQTGRPRSFFVKDGYNWARVEVADIRFVRSDTNLLFIHHSGGVTITRMTIAQLMGLLPPTDFLRVHKSYVVAIAAVQKIEKAQLRIGDTAIPVARTYWEEVERRLL